MHVDMFLKRGVECCFTKERTLDIAHSKHAGLKRTKKSNVAPVSCGLDVE